MENYAIKISRPSFDLPLRIYTVELDGFQVGKLKACSELIIPTCTGNHTLSFLILGKVEKSVHINIPENQFTTSINAKMNLWKSEIVLELENGISIPTPTTYSGFNLRPTATISYGKNSMKYSYSSFQTTAIVLVISIVLIAITMLNIISDSSESSPSTVQTQEMTDEEKAQIEITNATACFSDGEYIEALEICHNITELYPDTEIASNIGKYIEEQYSSYPSFTAQELMAEYDANIVNADKEFTDKVMIVSGIVSHIDKTNNDKNLAVLLESGTLFYCVQLNFDIDQTDAVSALKEGDSVKAIGKCTGKSGKHFLVFDGENVMISNCLMLD